jgi:hypothetical protein
MHVTGHLDHPAQLLDEDCLKAAVEHMPTRSVEAKRKAGIYFWMFWVPFGTQFFQREGEISLLEGLRFRLEPKSSK